LFNSSQTHKIYLNIASDRKEMTEVRLLISFENSSIFDFDSFTEK